MAKFVTITLADGTICDGILLSPADSGEGTSNALVIPLDRGSGATAPVEAKMTGADQYVQA